MFCSSANEDLNTFYNMFYCLVEKGEGDTIIDAAFSGSLDVNGCAFFGNAGSVSLFRVRGTKTYCQPSSSYFKWNGLGPLFAEPSRHALYGLIHCHFDLAVIPHLANPAQGTFLSCGDR
jgi:hypothetical protein